MDPAGVAGLKDSGPLRGAKSHCLASAVGHVGYQLVLRSVGHEGESGHFFDPWG